MPVSCNKHYSLVILIFWQPPKLWCRLKHCCLLLPFHFNICVVSNRKHFKLRVIQFRRSWFPRGLRCRPVAAGLLGLRLRIPPRARIFFSCECFVLYRYRFLRRAYLSFREVIPNVCVCVCVCVHVSDQVESNPLRLQWVGTSDTSKKLYNFLHPSSFLWFRYFPQSPAQTPFFPL